MRLASIAVALMVGTVELLQVVQARLALRGGVWGVAGAIDLNVAGLAIVALFVVIWALALAIWRFGNIEARWAPVAGKGGVADAAYTEPVDCPLPDRACERELQLR